MTEPGERRGLGRGLAALMGDLREADSQESNAKGGQSQLFVALDKLHPNPEQPRRRFPPHELEELAASIKSKGIIQPLIVRQEPSGGEGEYQIVAGERRWRAAQIAQVHQVPVLLRELDDQAVLEIAIIENVQRSDLNVLEEAEAYRQLMDKFGHTQERLSQGLGKSRSHIANILRLLSLPEEVQQYLRDGRLTAGHARALITAADPSALAQSVLAAGMSVRDTENLARRQRQARVSDRAPGKAKDADTLTLESDLSATLGMRVSIEHDAESGGGSMRIRYRDVMQLDALCRQLSGSHNHES